MGWNLFPFNQALPLGWKGALFRVAWQRQRLRWPMVVNGGCDNRHWVKLLAPSLLKSNGE